MNDDRYRNYLHDLGRILRDEAIESKRKRDAATTSDSRLFSEGYLLALTHVIDTMQQQCIGFQIPLQSIGLDGFDPVKELTPE